MQCYDASLLAPLPPMVLTGFDGGYAKFRQDGSYMTYMDYGKWSLVSKKNPTKIQAMRQSNLWRRIGRIVGAFTLDHFEEIDPGSNDQRLRNMYEANRIDEATFRWMERMIEENSIMSKTLGTFWEITHGAEGDCDTCSNTDRWVDLILESEKAMVDANLATPWKDGDPI